MIPLRLILYGVAALALVGGIGGVVWKIKHDEAAKWKERVEAAQNQGKVEAVATQAVDRYHENTIVIRERADRAVQTVERAAGADDPVPPDVLRAWLSGLQHTAPSTPADHRAAEPPGGM